MTRIRWATIPFVGLVALTLACGGAAAPTATVAPAPAVAATATRAPAAAAATATPVGAPAPTVVAMAKPSGQAIVALAGVLGAAGGQGGRGDLDPGNWVGGSRGLYRVIYEPLAYTNPMDPTGRDYLSPILATGWEVSKDGLAWTISLRKGVKFHNGEGLTAQVMARNIERYNGIGLGLLHQNRTAIEFPDTNTLVLRFKEPNLGLLAQLVHTTRAGYPVPGGYLDKYGKDVPSTDIRNHPIGTGPYKFVSMDTVTDGLVMEAWEDWGGYWGFKPTVKTIRLVGSPEDTTRMAMLATGEADLAAFIPGPYLKEARGFTVKNYLSVRTDWSYFLRQTHADSPYSNVKVRQALNYAVDKEAIIKAVLGGAGIPVGQNIALVQFGYNPDVKPYPYDPQKARQLLTEAGYPSGFDGGRIVSTDAPTRNVNLAIADFFGKVGVRLEIAIMDGAQHSQRVRRPIHDLDKDMSMTTSASSLGGEADYRIEFAITSNGLWSYTNDAEIDALYARSTRAATQSERERLIQMAALRSNEQATMLFLWNRQSVYGWGSRIADWTLTPGEDVFDNAQSIRLK